MVRYVMAIREEMTDSPEHHRNRSEFIRKMVQRCSLTALDDRYRQGPPKTIVQFWHDVRALPKDVEDCVASWTRWKTSGFVHRLFDADGAKAFIGGSLDARHERAFERCYHPAMQADYFRLCYLLVEGGFYVDADDVCVGAQISWLFEDGRLKIQPLCYDIASGTMVNQPEYIHNDACNSNWIYYFNNNPLVVARGHPVIERALQQATNILERACGDELPEIQATTGPGNLSKSIFELGTASGDVERSIVVLRDWDSCAVSRWPLSYRDDARNWRLCNRRRL